MNSTFLAKFSTLLLLLVIATGCQDVYFTDDIDLVLDFNPLTVDDALHSPYVIGTTVRISAHTNKKHDSTLGWTIEFSDPDIMEVVKQRDGGATCVALAAGHTTVRVYSDVGVGELLHEMDIEVREPTRVEMYAHGPLLLGQTPGRALVDEPTVLNGNTGTFLLRYFDEDTRLYGNGVLEAVGHESVTLTPETSYLFENREWLQIRPTEPGRHTFELRAAGVSLGDFSLLAVEKDAVEGLILHHSGEYGAHFGENLLLWAEAVDIDGNTVFGVEPNWKIDGNPENRSGDLYRYDYDPDNEVVVEAGFRGHEASTTIHAGEGYVSSTNKVGCSFGGLGGGGSSAVYLLFLAAIPLLVLRTSGRKTRHDVSR